MTSKWIIEIINNADFFDDDIFITLGRIDDLLRRASLETDNEALHDEIRKELVDTDLRDTFDTNSSDSSSYNDINSKE